MNDASFQLSSEELLEILSLSENATAIYTTGDIIIQSANSAMLKFWGKDKSIIGMPIEDGVPELKGQPFIGMFKEVWNKGVTITGKDTPATTLFEGRLQTLYYDFTYRPVKDASGNVKAILHTATDVTARVLSKQRETALNEELQLVNRDVATAYQELMAANEELGLSQDNLIQVNRNLAEREEQLQFAIDATSLGTWDLNPRTLKFTANERLKKWFGVDAYQEIELSNAINVIAENDRQHVADAIKKALQYESGGNYEIEYTIINPVDNKPRTVKGKGKVLFNIDKEAVRFSGTLQDVTLERKAKEELKETNERLQLALDAGKLGSYDLDLHTGKMICTDQCKLNYGWPVHKEFTYDELKQSIQPEYRKYLQNQIEHAIETGSSYNAEYAIEWADGSEHWLSESGIPRYDNNGHADRIVAVTYDITERRQAEQRKDDFISIASHELKTPVTSLKASLQMLDRMKDDPSPKMFPRLIEQSNRSMEKITSLIEDLLNVSRMNEGQLRLNKNAFVMGDLLSECCDHVRIAGKHELIIEGDKNLKVYADEHRIDQVIVNLVNNAVKYAPNSKEIYLQVEKDGNMAKISVKDNGPGIAPEKLNHLFNRYYQANSSGFQNSGLGLGLYISSEIINRHGGRIGVDSELGKGSTFWFTLPLGANADKK